MEATVRATSACFSLGLIDQLSVCGEPDVCLFMSKLIMGAIAASDF